MKVPASVKQSFDAKLLNISKNWISFENYEEIKKINNFYRHGLKYFPGKMLRSLQAVKRTMPIQGIKTLTLKRHE